MSPLPDPYRTLLQTPGALIMGILNVTPDSFSDGGLYHDNVPVAVEHARGMLAGGAAIIDIGGESTRPGSVPTSAGEELRRVLPVLRAVRSELDERVLLSVDTYKAEVAHASLAAGADIINCLCGSELDPAMIDVVREHACPIILYHLRGQPRTMQDGEIVYNDVVDDIIAFFQRVVASAQERGLAPRQIFLDPGIGFGKTLEHNVELLQRLDEFHALGRPLVIGVSRKGHLGRLLQQVLDLDTVPPTAERLEAALAETAIAIINGVRIIRTHDVQATSRFVRVFEATLGSSPRTVRHEP
jgi:dihydropteroate synthase